MPAPVSDSIKQMGQKVMSDAYVTKLRERNLNREIKDGNAAEPKAAKNFQALKKQVNFNQKFVKSAKEKANVAFSGVLQSFMALLLVLFETIKEYAGFLVSKMLELAPRIFAMIPSQVTKPFGDFITHYRHIFIVIFLLPISIMYDIGLSMRRWWYRSGRQWVQWALYGEKAANTHEDRVKYIQDQVKSVPDGMKMCTARPTWFAMSLKDAVYKTKMARIDVSLMDNVLSIDSQMRTVKVEPNVTMGQVTAELIPKGWTLAVVPELDDLTVGGLINGFGIETSSHKYGLFQHICKSFEIVMADGKVVKASKHENPELYASIPWSHGSLGFLTCAELQIVPAKKYVQMTYLPCTSQESMITTFNTASRCVEFDFVEMLSYGKRRGVVMVGKMVNGVEEASNIMESSDKFMNISASKSVEHAGFLSSMVNRIVNMASMVFQFGWLAVINVINGSGFDGIAGSFGSNVAGRMSGGKVNAIGKWWKPWFYKGVGQFLLMNRELVERDQDWGMMKMNIRILDALATVYQSYLGEGLQGSSQVLMEEEGEMDSNEHVLIPSKFVHQELIPLRDYYHRHTRSIFWELKDLIPFGNNFFFRLVLGWAVPPHISLLKVTQTPTIRKIYEKAHVVQDMLVPISTLGRCLDFFDRELGVYPLWVCPMRLLSPPDSGKRWDGLLPRDDDRRIVSMVQKNAEMDEDILREIVPTEVEAVRYLLPKSSPIRNQVILDTQYHADKAKHESLHRLSSDMPGGMVSPCETEQLYVDIGAYGVPRAPQWQNALMEVYGEVAVPSEENDEYLQENADEVKIVTSTPESQMKDKLSPSHPEDDNNTQSNAPAHIRIMRRLESFVRKNHGYQALYADCLQSKREFETMFEHELTNKVRNEYGCVSKLPTVYEKVGSAGRR